MVFRQIFWTEIYVENLSTGYSAVSLWIYIYTYSMCRHFCGCCCFMPCQKSSENILATISEIGYMFYVILCKPSNRTEKNIRQNLKLSWKLDNFVEFFLYHSLFICHSLLSVALSKTFRYKWNAFLYLKILRVVQLNSIVQYAQKWFQAAPASIVCLTHWRSLFFFIGIRLHPWKLNWAD